MAKIKDIGLEHILKLGIEPAKDSNTIYKRFIKKYGENKAKEIMDSIYGLGEKEGMSAMYDAKNKDYDIAMIFSGSYDADIIRKACNWIYEHKDSFGDTILEVGCDCGFITTFLGTIFPNKKIIAIDRNAYGIEIAKKNVEKFGITNVNFLCTDVMNLNCVKFDTVLSMRTLQENLENTQKENPSNELMEQADIFENEIDSYSKKLSSLLTEKGKLISIERLHRDALFLAWIKSLYSKKIYINADSFSELKCKEIGNSSTFEALLFSKEPVLNYDPFMAFMNCIADCMDTSLAEYDGWDAKIMYAFTGGEIIDGIEIYDNKNRVLTRTVCRMNKYDNSCILWYQNTNGHSHLGYYDISLKDSCINELNKVLIQTSQNKQYSVHKFR